MSISLKICGMKYTSNIRAILEHRPDYMGFIFYPKSKRFVGEWLYDAILEIDFGQTKKVGVFVDEDLDKLKQINQKWQFDIVQLHGFESPNYCARLKKEGVEVIKVFHIDEDFEFEKLDDYKDCVDYFLFDTKTPKMGGSGKVFDWSILEKYNLEKPLFLSGGIGLENLEDALKVAKKHTLYALDINSKIEKNPGLKDELLVKLITRKLVLNRDKLLNHKSDKRKQ